MGNASTLNVGLDVHKDAITVAYAIDSADEELLGKVGTTQTEVDRLCKRVHGKAGHVRFVYEAVPCGYGPVPTAYREGFRLYGGVRTVLDCEETGDRVKTDRRDAILVVRMGDQPIGAG